MTQIATEKTTYKSKNLAIPCSSKSRSPITKNFLDETINYGLYLPGAKRIGFKTNRPHEWLFALEEYIESDNNLSVDWKEIGHPGPIEQVFAPIVAKSKKVCTVEIHITTGNIFFTGPGNKTFSQAHFPKIHDIVKNKASSQSAISATPLPSTNIQSSHGSPTPTAIEQTLPPTTNNTHQDTEIISLSNHDEKTTTNESKIPRPIKSASPKPKETKSSIPDPLIQSPTSQYPLETVPLPSMEITQIQPATLLESNVIDSDKNHSKEMEKLWDENQSLKNALRTLEAALTTATEALKSVRTTIVKNKEEFDARLQAIEISFENKLSLQGDIERDFTIKCCNSLQKNLDKNNAELSLRISGLQDEVEAKQCTKQTPDLHKSDTPSIETGGDKREATPAPSPKENVSPDGERQVQPATPNNGTPGTVALHHASPPALHHASLQPATPINDTPDTEDDKYVDWFNLTSTPNQSFTANPSDIFESPISTKQQGISPGTDLPYLLAQGRRKPQCFATAITKPL